MKQQGKFLLFEFQEFATWLAGLTVQRPIKLIQNHHTWRPNYAEFRQLPDPFHWLQSMEEYQMTQEGFSQIAQNLSTYPDGTLAVCRPFEVPPAGISGANHFGLCIEHLGDFDNDDMTQEQKDTVVKLNAILCKKFDITINTDGIQYHHWWDIVTSQRTNGTGQVKSCPGVKFFGGNSVESCENNFIPLVKNALQTL